MKLLKRGMIAGTLVAMACGAMASSASASISPSPYNFSTLTGTFTTVTPLGTTNCDISNITGSLSSTTGGASGTISSLTITCRAGGVIQRAVVLNNTRDPITVSLDTGITTLGNVKVLVTTALGTCLYAGSLAGTFARGASTITASNTRFPLFLRLAGICSNPADVRLTVPTGATITW